VAASASSGVFEDQSLPELIAAVARHPGHGDGVLGLARTSIELYSADPLLNVVASDRGRFMVALMALHLHHGAPEGLTPAGLKAVCLAGGVCSAGRTAALIAMMRWAGYLTPAAGSRRLIPTDRFFELHSRRIERQLAVTGAVSPEALEVSRSLADHALLGAFASAQARIYLSGFTLTAQAPALAFCLDRISGFLILTDLMLRGWGQDRPWLPLSVKGYARRFSISRTHVQLVLREAQDGGLIRRDGGLIRAEPPLLEALGSFFTAVLAVNSRAARQALAERAARA
jgi:hypothetical protein